MDNKFTKRVILQRKQTRTKSAAMNFAGLLLLLPPPPPPQVKRKAKSMTKPCPRTIIKGSTVMKRSSHLVTWLLVVLVYLTMAKTAGADDQFLPSTTPEESGAYLVPLDLFTSPDNDAAIVGTRDATKSKDFSVLADDRPETLKDDVPIPQHYDKESVEKSKQAKNVVKKTVRSSSQPTISATRIENTADNEQHVFQQQGKADTSAEQPIKPRRQPSISNTKKDQSDPAPEEKKLFLQYGQTSILKEEEGSGNKQHDAFEQNGENDATAVQPIMPRRKPNMDNTNKDQASSSSEEQTLLLQQEDFNFVPHLSEQELQEETYEEEYNFFAHGAHDEELKSKTRAKSTTSAHLPTRMFNMAVEETHKEFNELKGTNSRVLVHYINREGRKLILQAASKIHHDFADENLLAVDMESTDAIEKLRQSAWIDRVEEDSIWIAQGFLERIVQEDELRNGRYWQDQNLPHENSHSRNIRRRRRHQSVRKLVEQVPYGIPMIQADQVQVGPHLVQVCIVDTGIGLDHPDIDPARADGIDRESDVDGQILHWNEDVRGHGTHVSGIMAAKSKNDLGVRGVGDVHVFMTRGLDNEGRAYESDIREAMEQCEAAGAKIINLSLGGSKMSSAMKSICDRLYKKGFLIFAAAGNSGEWKLEYPASDPTVVSVSAVDSLEWYWANANYGPTQELMAPGVSIISTTWSAELGYTYAEYSGTSMATPHASAAAAVLWSHRPECTNQQIRYALAYTAKDKGSEGCDSDFGYGIIQIRDALDFLNKYPCVDANWGRNHGSGNCTTVDEEPDPSITFSPSDNPSSDPTENPTIRPTQNPTTSHPVASPTLSPTVVFTENPSDQPSKGPAKQPTMPPTIPVFPTNPPSLSTEEEEVVTKAPDAAVTLIPTTAPSASPNKPTPTPPTSSPTSQAIVPEDHLTSAPTLERTTSPTYRPTGAPATQPTPSPTNKRPTLPPRPTPTGTTRQPTPAPTVAPPEVRPRPPPTTPTDPQTSSPTVGIDLGEAEVTPFPTETPAAPSILPPPPLPSAPSLPDTTTTTTGGGGGGGREWFRTSSGEMTTVNSWPKEGGGNDSNNQSRGGNPNRSSGKPGVFTSGSKSRRSGGAYDEGPTRNHHDPTPDNWFRSSSSFNGVFNIYGRRNNNNNENDDNGRRRRRWNGD